MQGGYQFNGDESPCASAPSRKRPRTEGMPAIDERTLQSATMEFEEATRHAKVREQRAKMQTHEISRRCDSLVDLLNQDRAIARELHTTNNSLHVRAVESEAALAEERSRSTVNVAVYQRRQADLEDQRNHATCIFAKEALYAEELHARCATLTQSGNSLTRVQQWMEHEMRRRSFAREAALSQAYRASRDASKFARLAKEATRRADDVNQCNDDLQHRMRQNLNNHMALNRERDRRESSDLERVRQDNMTRLNHAVEAAVDDERILGHTRLDAKEHEHTSHIHRLGLEVTERHAIEIMRVRDEAVLVERQRGQYQVRAITYTHGMSTLRAVLDNDIARQHDHDVHATRCEGIRRAAAEHLKIEGERMARDYAINLASAVEAERARGQSLLDLEQRAHATTLGTMERERNAAEMRASHTLQLERDRASNLLIVTNQATEDTLLAHTYATSLLARNHASTVGSMERERNAADVRAAETLQLERDRASQLLNETMRDTDDALLAHTHATSILTSTHHAVLLHILKNHEARMLEATETHAQARAHLERDAHAHLVNVTVEEREMAHVRLVTQRAISDVVYKARIATFVDQNAALIEQLRLP